jgi:hypothetical protein
MVYLKRENIFAYCHWWNSITKKMQGGYKTITKNDNLKTLIANYSFNEMITKLVIEDGDEVCKEYKRTSKAITLIPGPQGGLYPRSSAQLLPEDIGLVEYRGISIGWPDSRIRPSDNPLAQIIEVSESEDLEVITHFNGHRAAYKILKPYSKYRVISKGMSEWRGRECLFLDVIDCNDRLLLIRCGEQLCKLMINETKKTYFRTENLTPGGRDFNVTNNSDETSETSDLSNNDEISETNDLSNGDEISEEESIIDRVRRLRIENNI